MLPIGEAIAAARARGLDPVQVAEAAEGRPATCRIRLRPPEEETEPLGKKLHDPLAACCAIAPEIATWAEVELFRESGKWGARLQPGSRTHIITDVDREAFLGVLTEHAATSAPRRPGR